MPELPEVETTRRGIAPAILGRRISAVVVREPRLRWRIAATLPDAVSQQTVRAVRRRAKYLLIDLDQGSLILHLGMSGNLRVMSAETAPLTHDHVDIVLETGQCLRFNDPRRFGSLHFTEGDPGEHPLLRRLAPEPLEAGFDGAYLARMARRRKVAIKQFIMDSHVVVGVGNIYASESLFRAGIRPRRAAGRVTRDEMDRLAKAIQAVLEEAIKVGGTTLRDYVSPEGASGYFRQKLFVYERAGEPCRRCKTPVRQITQGGRSTYYCPTCQK
jgi:formamidopyrimidine-DNA glycosylase